MKKKLHFLFSMVALMLVASFARAQEDVTSQYVKNADLSTDVTAADNGWTCTWKQDYQKATDDTHVNVVEFYAGWGSLEHTEFSVSQEITLPAGDYRIAVNAFYRQGNDGNGTNNDRAYIFAGEKRQNVAPFSPGLLNSYSGNSDLWKASNAFYQGQFSNAFDFSIDEDNTTISIGFAGTFDEARCWVILGPVKLYKYSLENYLADYRTKVTEANQYVGKKMGSAEETALNTAIIDESTFTKSSEITAAIATLSDAITKANTSILNYEAIKSLLDAGAAIKANSTNADAIETYDAAIKDIVDAYEAGTIADFDAAKATINSALPALAKTQTAAGSDMTAVVSVTEWTAAQVNLGAYGDAKESYKAGNDGYNPGKVIYQKIEGLTPGIYKVEFLAVANHAREGSAFGDGIAQLYANNTTEDITVIDQDACSITDYPRTLTTKVFGDGILEYGIQNVAQGGQWYVVKASHLTFVEPITAHGITIDNEIKNGTVEADAVEAYADEKVSLTITPAEGYQLETLSVKAGEEDVEVAEDFTFVMPAAAVTISATFAEIPVPQYAITISNEIENGAISANPTEAKEGETVTLTITPAEGYELDELSVKAGEEDVEVAEGYTFEMPASAVTVSATFKEKDVEPETALIKNADFSESTPLDNHLSGYGKDMASNGTTYYGLQDVEGWNKVVVAGVKDDEGFENAGMGGGVFAYGSSWQMKGNNKTAPAAGPDGKEGQALGFFGVWGNGGYYYQDVTLPAGEYTLIVPIYNQSGTQANTTQTGFFVTGSDTKYTVAINTAVGKWTTQSVDFTLTEETAGQIRLGYVSTGGGSSANPMLYFDQVKLVSKLDGALELYDIALEDANKAAQSTIVTGEEMTTLNEVIAANANIDKTSLEAVEAATKALNDAVSAFNAIKPAYQQLADTKALVEIDAWPYASASKKAAVEEAMDATATSADDATAKATVLIKAYRQFVESNAIAEGVEGAVVMTDKITNPAATDETNNWTTKLGEGSGGSIGVKVGTETKEEPWTDSEDNVTHNYFDGGNWGAQSWDVSLEQEITLEPGKYMLTAIARASGDVAFSLYAGETKVTIPAIGATGGVFNRGWNDQFVEFEVEEAGAIKIGVQGVVQEHVHNWMSFSNFRLVQLEAAPVPDIVLNAPTFNMEEGTQEEPSLYPAGTALKVNFTAENLGENGLTEDDVQVKITVIVSGDLPEAVSMGSTTAHSVMGESFNIPLGETDFPVALKNGYVYQNVVIMSAVLVKPATETEDEETLAAYFGDPIQLHWIGLEAENIPDQINGIDAAKAKRNGKFYKKGHLVILNEGKSFSLNGIETE